MKIIAFLSIAVKSLWANRMRSALTMLGLIIGVGAVITLMSVGRGAEASITSSFDQMGGNMLTVMPANPDAPDLGAFGSQFAPDSLTMADAEAIERNVRSITGVAPTIETYIEIVVDNEEANTVVEATSPAFLEIINYNVAIGQNINDRHIKSRDTVVVLGYDVYETFFDGADPIGETVKINDKRFTVIGVLEDTGGSLFGISYDDLIIMPITTYQTRLAAQSFGNQDTVPQINVKVSEEASLDQVKYEIEQLLRRRHNLDEGDGNDFSVVSPEELLDIIQQVTGVFTIFLGAIASISLLVGSIGIMNIMLVSVTERTREIGLRKAIGAKRRDILLQFLLEAATLSLIGGGIGILGGYAVSTIISLIDIGGQTINSVVTSDIIILSISVSVFIGIASGIYPAMRAARMDPINALRYG